MADFDINLVIKDGQAIGQIRQLRTELDQTEKKASGVKSVLSGLFAGFGIYKVAQEFIELANVSGTLDNRLKLATGSVDGATAAFERLRQISNDTRSPLEENVALFQRVSQAQKELGASNEELYTFVKATGTALAIQGGSAATARGALIQLSQTIGGTIVHAEEFNSILDGALPLAQAAARGIDEAGGSVAKLRQLVVAGKISSKEFFDAIIEQAPLLQSQFEQTNATLAQSFTVLQNNLVSTFKDFDKATGLSKTLAEAIIALSTNLGLAAEAVALLGAGFVAWKLAPLILSVVQMTGFIIQLTAALGFAETATLLFSQAVAYLRLAGLALMATPLGIWLGIATVAIGAIVLAFRQGSEEAFNMQKATSELDNAMQNFADKGGNAAAKAALDIARNNVQAATNIRDAAAAERDFQQALIDRANFAAGAMGQTVDQNNGSEQMKQFNQDAAQASILVDALVYREKQAVQEVIRLAEQKHQEFITTTMITKEMENQYEYYGKSRRESEEQLKTAQDLLTKYQQEAAIAEATAKFGADSYQVTKLRNQYEILALQNQLKGLQVSEALKNQIIEAAKAGQELGSINIQAAIELGVIKAGELTTALLQAAGAARSIQIPSAGALIGAFQGGVSKLGGFLNYVRGTVTALRLENLKPTGGGGGSTETFQSQLKAMNEQIAAFGPLNRDQGLYNKLADVASQINRKLTESERELITQAYTRIQQMQAEQTIYGQLHQGAVDYSTQIAALNDLVKQGAINQTEYSLALSKVKLVQDLSNVDKSIGGNFDYRAQLQEVRDTYAERQNIIQQALEAELITQADYQARALALQKQMHLEAVNVEAARWDFAISSASDSINTILGFLKDQHKEQTGLYKALFIAQKAAAIAEATVNTARAVTNALAAPFPPPIPQALATAAAVAGGAQIAAIVATSIQGLATGGQVRGPGGPKDDKAGLFALSNGEFVVNANATQQYLPLLEAINKGQSIRGLLADGGLVNQTNVTLKNTGSTDVENAKDSKPQNTKVEAKVSPDPVHIINVSSKEAALAAVASVGGKRVVMNLVEEERTTFRSILGIRD